MAKFSRILFMADKYNGRSPPPPPLFSSEAPATRHGPVIGRGRADRSRAAGAAAAGRKSPLLHAAPSPVPAATRPVSNHQIIRPQPKRLCTGLYGSYVGPTLYFSGRPMLSTGRQLMEWSKEGDTGVASFKRSMLATSKQILLSYYGVSMTRGEKGFTFHHSQCEVATPTVTAARCTACASSNTTRKNIRAMYQPAAVGPAGVQARIDYITNNPKKARNEIAALRERERRLKREL